MHEVVTLSLSIGGAAVSGMVTAALVTWWLSRQFVHMMMHIADVREALLCRMNEHEKLDDARFNSLDLQLMRIGLASGITPFETLPNVHKKP